MFKNLNLNEPGRNAAQLLITLILFGGVIGLINLFSTSNTFANSTSSPISSPVSPSPTPVSAPISPTPSPVAKAYIQSFTLVNAKTDKDIKGYGKIADYQIIRLSKLPSKSINIRANTFPQVVEKVKFKLTINPFFGKNKLSYSSTDTSIPYALFSDNGAGDYYGHTLKPYTFYTLTALPYAATTQTAGLPSTVHFFILP